MERQKRGYTALLTKQYLLYLLDILLKIFLMDLSHFYVILDYAIALSNTVLIKDFVWS